MKSQAHWQTNVLAGFARTAPILLTKAGQIQKRFLVQIDDALRYPEGAAKVITRPPWQQGKMMRW